MQNQWLSASTFRNILNINTCTCAASDVYKKVHSSIICDRKKLETSQMFTYGRMVEYVIYSCSKRVYGNKKEVATAVCNNNLNVINIILSRRSYAQKSAYHRLSKQAIPDVMPPSWRQPVSNDWSMLDTKGHNSSATHWIKWGLGCDCYPACDPVFLKISMIDILRGTILCSRGDSVHERVFNSILGFYPLDANIFPRDAKYISGYKIFPIWDSWCNPVSFSLHGCWYWEHPPINFLHANHWICGTPQWVLFI